MILILAPIFFPIAMELGIDPIHLRHHHGGEHGDRPDPRRRSGSTCSSPRRSPACRWARPSAQRCRGS
ncbi:hypothetical protein ACPA9J_20120 [Pseudomonas aeruginosa]